MQALAERAAGFWPLDVTSISLAAHRENAVFKVDAAEGVFALRLHRPGYRTSAELAAELEMMRVLDQQQIAVPRPLAGRDGGFLQLIEGVQVSVLSWLPGRLLGQTGQVLDVPDRRGTFHALGEIMARMHTCFDAWPKPAGFTRPTWDRDGLVGDHPVWGRFWDNPMLTPQQVTRLIAARDKLRVVLSDDRFDVGLIHADLVSENLLIDGPRLAIIDFDDSGFGYRLQDVATALVKHQAEPDYADLRASLLQGYATRRNINAADVDIFLLIRHLSYVGWIAARMTDERSQARSRLFIAQAVEKAEAFA